MFREVQQFRQKWLWGVLLLSSAAGVLPFGYGLWQQRVWGQPWGNVPLSDTALVVANAIAVLLAVALLYFFYVLKLVTEVKADGIHIQFFPLLRRTIAFVDIQGCQVRTYRPLREYGGWGIRFGFKGNAYNVSGDRGVELAFFQGKPLLIGSQKPEELAAAIQAHLPR
ncbi:DUF6141 family protein [Almyronema epifaneia]|uniref:DUF6141 family protein n=1 Tax=Almyronema epifaneia S1 TaxID=2991925 RepID=A0ABW6IBN6_9CYAN